jgi:hypothetical protein
MDRTDGLLIGGVALLAGAFRRLENSAVETTRRNIGLSVRRRVGRGRRLVRDTGALLQLMIAVVMLVQGLRAALREWSAVDEVEGAIVGTDIEPAA